MRRFIAVAAVALWAAVVSFSPARAADIAAEAGKFIDALGDQALAIVKDGSLSDAAKQEKFRVLLTQGFDVPAIGRFVIGKTWRTVEEPQRKEFLETFEALIVETYAGRFKEYQGEQFRIAASKGEGDDHAVVSSEVLFPNGKPPVKIDWRVLKPEGKLKVVDVMVEGVSMAVTQQQEYASVIQRSGMAGLIQQIKSQLKKS